MFISIPNFFLPYSFASFTHYRLNSQGIYTLHWGPGAGYNDFPRGQIFPQTFLAQLLRRVNLSHLPVLIFGIFPNLGLWATTTWFFGKNIPILIWSRGLEIPRVGYFPGPWVPKGGPPFSGKGGTGILGLGRPVPLNGGLEPTFFGQPRGCQTRGHREPCVFWPPYPGVTYFRGLCVLGNLARGILGIWPWTLWGDL